jgi:hypothetical protein
MKSGIRVHRGWLLTVAMLVVGPRPVAAQQTDDEARTSPSAIEAAEQAVDVADSFVGLSAFCKEKGRDIPPSAVVLSEFTDTIPYIGDTLVGRTAWRITYSGFDKVLNALADDSAFRTDLDECVVWVDSASGRLLQAWVKPSVRRLDESSVPTAAEFQEEARGTGDQYLGLPEHHPEVLMLDAVSRSTHWAIRARQLIVRLVRVSRRGGEPYPAWVVHMVGTGLDFFPASNKVKSSRLVVNATTGDAPLPWTHEHDRE